MGRGRKVTVVVDSEAAENVMPRSMFPEIGIRQTERSKNGKGFKGPGGENIKNCGQQVMSVRTLEGWQVAEVRMPLVSASHIIQAGNDLFIGKDEAYIMNRKKKEKSMVRKEGNVYVLELFVSVPPNVTAPVTYTPMEVDAINQVADGERAREASHVQLPQLNVLTAGRVSVEDRSKRAETVRPQLGERCEKRRECDSVLSATNVENGDELNGETDDEDMEDGDMEFNDGSAHVRNIRDPGHPTAKEHQEHMTTHRPNKS